jgi:tetratricopeptide (TPR) repeat protein
VLQELGHSLKTVEDWMKVGALYSLKRYEEALAAFEQAIRLDPNYISAHFGKSDALYNLGRFEEARAADHQGLIHIDLP